MKHETGVNANTLTAHREADRVCVFVCSGVFSPDVIEIWNGMTHNIVVANH